MASAARLAATAHRNSILPSRRRWLTCAPISLPPSFAGSLDPVLRFVPGVDLIEMMRDGVSDLRLLRLIDGAGHWVQQERPAEVNIALLEFLDGL